MGLFNRSDDQPKKPSFFQRIRQAVSGEPPPALPPSDASPPSEEQAQPDPTPIATPFISTPLAQVAESPNEFLAPQTAFELAELEGVETPAATPYVITGNLPPGIIAAEQTRTEPSQQLAVDSPQPLPFLSERNEYGLRPMNTNFSFGGYASAEEEDNYFLETMRGAVARTRDQFTASLDSVLSLGRQVDEDTLDQLEAVLLTADIGVATTQEIIGNLRTRSVRERATGPELKAMLREELRSILNEVSQPTNHPATAPEVIMLVGVNGTGKTTTSGKLAALYGTHGRRALLCAADTFRAAAIEQLEVWARRSNVDIIKTKQGGDPSAALYDALTAGKARKADIVIIDTAGRLHNKANLMAELDKMRRTSQKVIPGSPHQTFLVMDATTGQNGMQQAKLFLEAAHVTGIVLTKLDGTAKGGIVVAIARELGLPVVFAGTGEKMTDIVPFDNDNFIESLLG